MDVVVIPSAAIFVAVLGMAYLAFIDIARQQVDNWAIAFLGLGAAASLCLDGITVQQWMWALECAALSFLFHLELGAAGRVGGGDVKLAPIPAAILGAINPLLALWSIALAFSIQFGFQISIRGIRTREAVALPFVPAMTIGTIGGVLFGLTLVTA